MPPRSWFKERVKRAAQIIKQEGKMHYTKLAIMLNISPSYAREICRAIASFNPEEYYYEDGTIEYIGGKG